MKLFSVSFVAALLTAYPLASGSPVSPVEPLGVRSLLSQLECKVINDVLLKLQSSQVKAQASAFCSTYIRSTTSTTVTATVVQQTTVTDTTLTTLTSTTTTTAPVETITSLTYADCGIIGYDLTVRAYNVEDSGQYANLGACKLRCSNDPQCLSFAFGGSACLLYNVTVANNVNLIATSPYSFNDKDCPALIVPPAPTRPLVNRAIAIPSPLASLAATKIRQACSCLFTTPVPAATVTIGATVTTVSTETDLTTITATTEVVTSTIYPPAVYTTVTTSAD